MVRPNGVLRCAGLERHALTGARCEPVCIPWTAVVMDANGERMEKRRGFVAVIL